MKELIKNSVKCLKCNKILISRRKNDYVTCDCSNKTYCEGGISNASYGGINKKLIENLSIYYENVHEKMRKKAEWGSRGKNGKSIIKYIPIYSMSDNYIKKILTIYPDNINKTFKKIMQEELVYRTINNIKIND